MGLWFFLTSLVLGSMALKAYRLRMKMSFEAHRQAEQRFAAMEQEIAALKARIEQLDDAVLLGDFELNRQFHELKKQEERR